jgi:protein tyrosine/serine phosphatase
MMTLSRSRSILRWAFVMAAVMLVPALAFLAWDQATHNFGPVVAGSVYRSGQMPASALAQTIRERQIKTVVNLRGSNPSDNWYRDELSTTLVSGATHVDIAMSSCLWMSRAQLRTLVETLEKSERPLLVHCA